MKRDDAFESHWENISVKGFGVLDLECTRSSAMVLSFFDDIADDNSI